MVEASSSCRQSPLLKMYKGSEHKSVWHIGEIGNKYCSLIACVHVCGVARCTCWVAHWCMWVKRATHLLHTFCHPSKDSTKEHTLIIYRNCKIVKQMWEHLCCKVYSILTLRKLKPHMMSMHTSVCVCVCVCVWMQSLCSPFLFYKCGRHLSVWCSAKCQAMTVTQFGTRSHGFASCEFLSTHMCSQHTAKTHIIVIWCVCLCKNQL